MAKKDYEKERKKFLAHFPKGFSKEIKDYIDNTILAHSRYIFTERVKGIQFSYCTHCRKHYMTDGDDRFKENETVNCLKCKSECTVKASGRSRKYMIDDAYVVIYEKSRRDPQAIIARGLYVSRDYTGRYIDIDTRIEDEHLYLFTPGVSGMMYSRIRYHNNEHRLWSNVLSGFPYFQQRTKTELHICSLLKAIEGTPFQYSTWEDYQDGDMVRFFDLYCRYPCIEYLTKLNMDYFVNAKLYGHRTYSAINWSGKTIEQVLKITKQQIKEIKDYAATNKLHPLTLRLQQIIRKDGSQLSLSQLQIIAESYDREFVKLMRILKFTSLHRADNYIQKQYDILRQTLSYNENEIIITWNDYIKDCMELGYDLNQSQIIFPKNLHEKHQESMKLVKIHADEITNQKMRNRAESLQRNYFESAGLLIRPAVTSEELIREGKVLQHCVGGYIEDYLSGKNELYFIRRTSIPNKPYFTLEIRSGEVRQCRGLKNRSMTVEVKSFVEQFKAEKLTKKSNRRSPKEVAV